MPRPRPRLRERPRQRTARRKHPRHHALTDDLVADVISDTAIGVLPWHPDRCSLAQHLCSHIRSRTAKLRRPQHRRTVPLDQEAFTAEDTGTLEGLLSKERTSTLLDTLRRASLKRGDVLAAEVLDEFECGRFRRADIARSLGITVREYDRARERIRHRARAQRRNDSGPR